MGEAVLRNNTGISKMIKVDEAKRIILDSIKELAKEEEVLTGVLGRVLAEDIYADIDIPQLDNSAMDGYALIASATKGASRDNPVLFEVIEDLRAGYLAEKTVKGNQAVRIMTGAPIPQGADSVMIVENTSPDGKDRVKIFKEAKTGDNIRRSAEDIRDGELVISKGALLGPSEVGMLASLGRGKVKVTMRPKVAVLATGDEIIDIDERLEPGKLRSSNTYTLYSQVQRCGGIPKNLGIARDEPAELETKLKQGLDCDIILSSGGVSVGEYDFVKSVLSKMGTDMKFWKVAMRPGKPLVFGMVDGIPVFGLPGNPVSSMVSFDVFVRPAILKMLGQARDTREEVEAVLNEDIKKKKGLRYFLRAETKWDNGGYITRTTGAQGSGILKSMVLANSLIILDEKEEFVGKGMNVKVRFLD